MLQTVSGSVHQHSNGQKGAIGTSLLVKPNSRGNQLAEHQEAFYGKPLIVADRDTVETDSDSILSGAHTQDVALLVVGDPFGCSTSLCA
jgi:hypothetical protein